MKRDTTNDVGSSVISSDLKHRANDARDGSSSYSNRCDRSGLNGCCTAVWKRNGKNTTLYFSWIVSFQSGDIIYGSSAWDDGRQEDEEEDVGG
jgi:hypothetical protein